MNDLGMQSSTRPKQSAPRSLPDELVYHILRYLSPSEVIWSRLVSKQFNDVAHDTRLWRTLYATARLLRPPGPFLWQSTRCLEHILVQSERISHTWTSQPLQIVSRIQGPRSRRHNEHDLLFGRLVVWCEERCILAEDIETRFRQVIWESDRRIMSFKICSLRFPEGMRVFLVVDSIDEADPDRPRIKLRVFSLQDDTSLSLGPVIHEMDLPKEAQSPFSSHTCPSHLYFEGPQALVIDPRTYTILKFPPLKSSLPGTKLGHHSWITPVISLSGTFIVAMRQSWHAKVGAAKLVQIYTAPNLQQPSGGVLHLTHDKLISSGDIPILSYSIRDPVVDSSTGDISLRFLGWIPQFRSDTYYYCIDLVLPPSDPNSTEILPLSFNKQQLFSIKDKGHSVALEASSEGYVRGLVTCPSASTSFRAPGTVYKFSVDASGEICSAVVSEALETSDDRLLNSHAFDGVRGKVSCHSGDSFEVEVLDLR